MKNFFTWCFWILLIGTLALFYYVELWLPRKLLNQDCIYVITKEHIIPLVYSFKEYPATYLVRRLDGTTMTVLAEEVEIAH
jgi:hypothetical protein